MSKHNTETRNVNVSAQLIPNTDIPERDRKFYSEAETIVRLHEAKLLFLLPRTGAEFDMWRTAEARLVEIITAHLSARFKEGQQETRREFEEREAALCPEDVGIEEYVGHLKLVIERLETCDVCESGATHHLCGQHRA
jgi:hypothetical protein